MKAKYHVQVGKTQSDDRMTWIIRGLHSETRHIVVEAEDITEACKEAERVMMGWPGKKNKNGYNLSWAIDGHPKKRGSHIGPMIG